jgi:hypothetical protein
MRGLVAPGSASPGAVQAGSKVNPRLQKPWLPYVEKGLDVSIRLGRDHNQAALAAASMGLALAVHLMPASPCLAAASTLEVENSR